jgi:hypothetical protein
MLSHDITKTTTGENRLHNFMSWRCLAAFFKKNNGFNLNDSLLYFRESTKTIQLKFKKTFTDRMED